VEKLTGSVVDWHRFDPNFHFDSDPELNRDWHPWMPMSIRIQQNNADPTRSGFKSGSTALLICTVP
jgi:hypothetical protein